ncbi:metallophosphoesterase [Metabacillus rhizolycopersici]|uniref:Metallophosphoesterase n=1 Tax=Metabacillus rhizolycopersici TaxID=2875709 RepID=A0ABS7UP27_9BACI|nr:metallophosphoesterase [Metabacillus rhizolycopersici]MBZ5749679.1 metallophosphoesterase [Metabacillus rhizolycopersici]
MRKAGGRVLVGLLLFLVVLIIYTIWDNNRIKVVEQDIAINNLPDEVDGFKILQVTDLHEKQFGENQGKLIEKINAIDYDVIVFTGDMLISGTSNNYAPIYSLLEGIDNKEHALFVPGNSDPRTYVYDEDMNLKKHEFIEGMEKRGVKLLESIRTVETESTDIHFVDFELSILDPQKQAAIPTNARIAKYVQHRNQLRNEMSKLDAANDSDVVIALNHYPIVDARIDQIMNNPANLFRKYDLIMAGHYHGGQIRLPFIGALFVPEPYYENGGLFPPQDRVKGLWEYKQTKQYVSAGLGSSKTISFLKFRLFNTPEINVLKLKRKE